MKAYELSEPVTVETWYAGERCAFAGGPGVVKAKNELEERALEALLEARPGICKVVKAAKKAEE